MKRKELILIPQVHLQALLLGMNEKLSVNKFAQKASEKKTIKKTFVWFYTTQTNIKACPIGC